jgi:transcriptional regulator with XRE-family HTH domain
MADQLVGDGAGKSGGTRRHSPEGDALLVARTRLGMTQPAFAARLSELLGRRVDRTQVAKWEAGVYRPRAGVMLAAAAVVSMPLHELMSEGAAMRGPQAAAADPGRAPRWNPRSGSADLGEPRKQVLALLELGFTLPEAIDLVRRHLGSVALAPQPH